MFNTFVPLQHSFWQQLQHRQVILISKHIVIRSTAVQYGFYDGSNNSNTPRSAVRDLVFRFSSLFTFSPHTYSIPTIRDLVVEQPIPRLLQHYISRWHGRQASDLQKLSRPLLGPVQISIQHRRALHLHCIWCGRGRNVIPTIG